jgi:hypothetical protein
MVVGPPHERWPVVVGPPHEQWPGGYPTRRRGVELAASSRRRSLERGAAGESGDLPGAMLASAGMDRQAPSAATPGRQIRDMGAEASGTRR